MNDKNVEPTLQRADADALLQMFPDPKWLSQLDSLMLKSRNKVRGMLAGKRRSTQLGSSLEFADYRPYVSGDDVRKIDWNLYGRSAKAYIRQYWDEQERNFHVWIDSSESMKLFGQGEQNKWLFAMRIAVSIGYLALRGDDRLHIHLFTEQGNDAIQSSLYGKAATFRLLQQSGKRLQEELPLLQRTEQLKLQALDGGQGFQHEKSGTEQKSDMQIALKNPQLMPKRPGVCWIFTDAWYEDGISQVLQQLHARKQEVVFVHIVHDQELDPSLSGELKLIDIETQHQLEVAITPSIIQKYKSSMDNYQAYLKELCYSLGANYYCLNASRPFHEQFYELAKDHQTVAR